MKLLKKVKKIIVHHAAAPMEVATAWRITDWHRDKGLAEDGYAGYHHCIEDNGRVVGLRPEEYQGAHCFGHNHNSIGIVVSGDFRFETPTAAQFDSLIKLCADLVKKYSLRYWNIYGHRNMRFLFALPTTKTECPGDNLENRLKAVRESVMSMVDHPKPGIINKVRGILRLKKNKGGNNGYYRTGSWHVRRV